MNLAKKLRGNLIAFVYLLKITQSDLNFRFVIDYKGVGSWNPTPHPVVWGFSKPQTQFFVLLSI